MEPHTRPLDQHRDTGLTDSTHASSSGSAERYHLDEFDDSPILLYTYRGGLETSSQKHLCQRLDKNDSLRVTKKPIPRATSYLDIKRHDLYLPDEKRSYATFPNYDSSLASIKIPLLAYLGRLVWGSYSDLYIVSPESSPSSSVASESPRESRLGVWSQESFGSVGGGGGAAEED